MLIKTILIGIGATLIMDLWAYLQKLFNVKSLDYRFVGRWIGHMKDGKFSHNKIFNAEPIKYEVIIGWTAHYLIGIAFAFLLIAIYGKTWVINPKLIPALIISLLTIIAPFFIMQPAFGLGMAASELPNANLMRFRSLLTHLIFGLGLYLTALVINKVTTL